ncbi:FxsB family radical SAM/SPASM domain protein [Actinoplanes sp. KI2]|uniref:FxsB family cyclophane-forming radical SAM/SPASM peptide maturase n=1 Tax=Actinoplanes sp. KI2 TaxID=2983315 RepID=UPI0021D5B275|nr:FxsB family cyclophane-forming radical SAM/SPASM peptide maturase [Actinoplanes sp. KI2]MCU7728610.1 FxsB family radical SAM/SPASM domain protein [Actinoplanes sp. KI2]
MTRPHEWPADLDVTAALAGGFRPYAFREFVLKINQRCNLACDYCYVYAMGDHSWRDRPSVMSGEVLRTAAARIAEHAREHELDTVRVILHGGEPLLSGRDRLAALIGRLKTDIGDRRLQIAVQTNGLLLDEPMLDLFRAEGVQVGVSMDGAGADNDRHRRHADGRGSAAAVERALGLLTDARYRPIFAGILCTIDVTTDPAQVYEALLRHRPPQIDFLLPHANWSRPPTRPDQRDDAYGDWLVAVFDRWYDAPRQETRVRVLEEILSLVLGGASRSEQVGLSPVTVAVVESDGDIEQVDSLKSAFPGASATGLNIATNSFDQALRHPGIVARQLGAAALCAECVACSIHELCGAGHYAHRYATGRGFLNRSVYCADLSRIITHVRRRVTADIADRERGESAGVRSP